MNPGLEFAIEMACAEECNEDWFSVINNLQLVRLTLQAQSADLDDLEAVWLLEGFATELQFGRAPKPAR